MYTPRLHTHFQGQVQKHIRDITYNKDKLNYAINIRLIREPYGPIVENMALKTTLGTRPLLAMMLHTGTKKNTAIKRVKCVIDR